MSHDLFDRSGWSRTVNVDCCSVPGAPSSTAQTKEFVHCLITASPVFLFVCLFVCLLLLLLGGGGVFVKLISHFFSPAQ